MKKTLFSIVAIAAATSLSHGQLVVNETFNYTAGAIGTTATTGTGLTGNWAASHTAGASFTGTAAGTVVTGSIPAPTGYALASTNNKFSISSNGAAYAQLATPIASNVNQTFYTSFLLDLSAGGTDNSTFFNVGFAAIDGANNTDFLNFGKSSANANFGSTYAGTFAASGVVIDAAKNYLVVMKVDFVVAGNDSLSIKIFDSALDTVSATEPATWDQVRTGAFANTVALTAFGFRAGSAQTMVVDEIRMGDTWGSVVIPEPSTALLGLSALGLMALRRRRSL